MNISVERTLVRLLPDSSRVAARFFMPGAAERGAAIVRHVLELEEETATRLLQDVLRRFSARHRNISRTLETNYARVREETAVLVEYPKQLPRSKRLLIGAYFTMEYSIESTAFYNPSIVEAPDQEGLPPEHLRVIVSFRATGEGHISSIVFRSAVLDEENNILLDTPGNLVDMPETVRRHTYHRDAFAEKLSDMTERPDIVARLTERLDDSFTYGELRAAIEGLGPPEKRSKAEREVMAAIGWLADSHYEVTFSLDTALSDRVIFPVSYRESNGIEDARFVRLVDDEDVLYCATYTAYDGTTILPKLLTTRDFYHFKVRPLHGARAQNKGMSLFPRRINGRYAMVARSDGVNLYIMYSDDIHYWPDAVPLQSPVYPWEFVQIGNAGSPIETPEGWLLLTHGVGPMRTYCLGASLLDLEDPSRVIGRLDEPLLLPTEAEREGYVPNVLYSCGSIIHNGHLIVPYGMADYASSFAVISVGELLSELRVTPRR